MGKRAVEQAELRSSAPRRLKKDTVSRGEFYEAARTLEEKVVVGVSQGEWQVNGKWTEACLLQVDTPAEIGAMTVAYLSDPQVRELIQVLKDYLSAKED